MIRVQLYIRESLFVEREHEDVITTGLTFEQRCKLREGLARYLVMEIQNHYEKLIQRSGTYEIYIIYESKINECEFLDEA